MPKKQKDGRYRAKVTPAPGEKPVYVSARTLRAVSYTHLTSGSRVAFIREGSPPLLLHKPHPRKELLAYQVKQLLETLEQEGLL